MHCYGVIFYIIRIITNNVGIYTSLYTLFYLIMKTLHFSIEFLLRLEFVMFVILFKEEWQHILSILDTSIFLISVFFNK